MQVLRTGDLIASAVPVPALLRYAYDAPINPSPRLSGLPDWTIRERYNIEAKASETLFHPVFREAKYAADRNMPHRTEIEYFNGGDAINGEGTFRFLEKHLAWTPAAALAWISHHVCQASEAD